MARQRGIRGEGTYVQQPDGSWRWLWSYIDPLTRKRKRPDVRGETLKDCQREARKLRRKLATGHQHRGD